MTRTTERKGELGIPFRRFDLTFRMGQGHLHYGHLSGCLVFRMIVHGDSCDDGIDDILVNRRQADRHRNTGESHEETTAMITAAPAAGGTATTGKRRGPRISSVERKGLVAVFGYGAE